MACAWSFQRRPKKNGVRICAFRGVYRGGTAPIRSGVAADEPPACDAKQLVYASFWPFLEFKNDFQEKRKS